MKSRLTFILFVSIISPAAWGNVWHVHIGNYFFAPDSVVVALGDTVVWTDLEGTHNVVELSDPPIFDSGDPSPPPWTYQFTANIPLGVYSYHCEAHPQQMTGYISVIPYGTPPNIEFVDPSVPEGATVGRGIFVSVAPTDDDQDLTGFAMYADDTVNWTTWFPYSEFLIADTSLGLFDDNTSIVSNTILTPGQHQLNFRAIDSRGALSPIITRHVTVQDGFSPSMNPTVSGRYGGSSLYPDGSEYFRENATVELGFSASASPYYSLINAYRLRNASGIWSDWFAGPHIELTELAGGDFPVLLMARDIAGESSDTLTYTIRLVDFAVSDTIVIVDETRDGNGNLGSPADAEVDDFYRSVIHDRPYREHDYTAVQYLSPYNLRNAGLVIYHADDRSDMLLLENTSVLDEYLSLGGRLLLSGWDILSVYTLSDSIAFASGSFGYERLRLDGAHQVFTRAATGFNGANGYSGATLDPAKLPTSWGSSIVRTWVFSPRDGSTEVGVLTVNNPGQNPYEGRTVVYLYDGQFRVAVSGIPFYFCTEPEVQVLFDALVPVMMAPSAVALSLPASVTDMVLEQNYPNPFNSSTDIVFRVPRTEIVALRIYDVLGRQAALLFDGPVVAGTHHVSFDGSALSSGVYLLNLRSSSSSATRKLILLK